MEKYITPVFILIILFSCIKNKTPVYSSVIQGADDGLKMIFNLIPTMVVILSSVAMLRASGALDAAVGVVSPIFNFFNAPPEIIPMVIMRPISGSGSLGILSDMLGAYGADSRIGMLASVIMGSTETTFYTLAVYFGTAGIKNSKRVIPCAVIGDIAGVMAACLIIK